MGWYLLLFFEINKKFNITLGNGTGIEAIIFFFLNLLFEKQIPKYLLYKLLEDPEVGNYKLGKGAGQGFKTELISNIGFLNY